VERQSRISDVPESKAVCATYTVPVGETAIVGPLRTMAPGGLFTAT
jgi:hypothetical protein